MKAPMICQDRLWTSVRNQLKYGDVSDQVEREKAQAQRGRAHRRLRRGLPTGQRLRLNGIAAMHEVDFQELVEQLAGLAKVKDAEEEDSSPKPKHDWRTQLADKSPPAERCTFGESNRGEIPRPAEVPKAEKPQRNRPSIATSQASPKAEKPQRNWPSIATRLSPNGLDKTVPRPSVVLPPRL